MIVPEARRHWRRRVTSEWNDGIFPHAAGSLNETTMECRCGACRQFDRCRNIDAVFQSSEPHMALYHGHDHPKGWWQEESCSSAENTEAFGRSDRISRKEREVCDRRRRLISRRLARRRHYRGRVIPSFCILEISVVRFMPSLPAAPAAPPMTQLVSRRTFRM